MAWAYGPDGMDERQEDAKGRIALGAARLNLFQQLYAALLYGQRAYRRAVGLEPKA